MGILLSWRLYVLSYVVFAAVAANAATLLMQSGSSNGGPPPPKKFLGPGALDFAELASSAAASGDLSFPRRERFVFRPTHLEVLEKYFQDNNYPSFETREEIAQTCNQISEAAGVLLCIQCSLHVQKKRKRVFYFYSAAHFSLAIACHPSVCLFIHLRRWWIVMRHWWIVITWVWNLGN